MSRAKTNKKFWNKFQILFYEYDYDKLAKMISQQMSRFRQRSYADGFNDGAEFMRRKFTELGCSQRPTRCG